jgi:hypothetical protein
MINQECLMSYCYWLCLSILAIQTLYPNSTPASEEQPHTTPGSLCQNPGILLHQAYDVDNRTPFQLTYSPEDNVLCWRLLVQRTIQKADQEARPIRRTIALPASLYAIDAGIATGENLIVLAGRTQDNSSTVHALDTQGKTLWAYPSRRAGESDTLRFHDLEISTDNTRLFAAGSRNNTSILLILDLMSKTEVSHGEEVTFYPHEELWGSSYRQVISSSNNSAIVVRYPNNPSQQVTLERWLYCHNRWNYITGFCQGCSHNQVRAVALKMDLSGQQFFYIASTLNQLHFLSFSTATGDILDTVSLKTDSTSSLHWNTTTRINTPALLSASASITTSNSHSTHPTLKDRLRRIASELTFNPNLAIVNRGCLLGISSQTSHDTPLVINLCSRTEVVPEQQTTRPKEPGTSLLSFWPIVNSILAGTGVLSLVALCLKGVKAMDDFKRPATNTDPLQQLRKHRLDYLSKNRPAPRRPLHSDNPAGFSSAPSEILLPDISAPSQQQTMNWNEKALLKKEWAESLIILKQALNSARQSQNRKNTLPLDTPTAPITRSQLAVALAKVMIQPREKAVFTQHPTIPETIQETIPDTLTLIPMPPDQFCFYHAIGHSSNTHGIELFQAITTVAQNALQDSPELADFLNSFAGGEGAIDEMAAMGHVNTASEQIWGHVDLLPFICWYLELTVVVVTPGTWQSEAGALLFMPNGQWEMINGNKSSILAKLDELHRVYPSLLIMQHDGHSHWDVLKRQPPASSE